ATCHPGFALVVEKRCKGCPQRGANLSRVLTSCDQFIKTPSCATGGDERGEVVRALAQGPKCPAVQFMRAEAVFAGKQPGTEGHPCRGPSATDRRSHEL